MSLTLDHIRELPPIQWYRRRQYYSAFPQRGGGKCRGVYASFADAAAAVPKHLPVGYDTPATGGMYRERIAKLSSSDYPAMFWLQQALEPGARVFDFGGHVGVAYYGFRRLLPFPEGTRWTVYDVPAVVEAGRAFAAEMEGPAPAYTTDLADGDGADVWMALGALMYEERPLRAILEGYTRLPRYVLVNKTPTHPTREFVTVQHIGFACCPYRIHARQTLPDTLAPLGYELRDVWENTDMRVNLPFERDVSPITHTGYLFRLR